MAYSGPPIDNEALDELERLLQHAHAEALSSSSTDEAWKNRPIYAKAPEEYPAFVVHIDFTQVAVNASYHDERLYIYRILTQLKSAIPRDEPHEPHLDPYAPNAAGQNIFPPDTPCLPSNVQRSYLGMSAAGISIAQTYKGRRAILKDMAGLLDMYNLNFYLEMVEVLSLPPKAPVRVHICIRSAPDTLYSLANSARQLPVTIESIHDLARLVDILNLDADMLDMYHTQSLAGKSIMMNPGDGAFPDLVNAIDFTLIQVDPVPGRFGDRTFSLLECVYALPLSTTFDINGYHPCIFQPCDDRHMTPTAHGLQMLSTYENKLRALQGLKTFVDENHLAQHFVVMIDLRLLPKIPLYISMRITWKSTTPRQPVWRGLLDPARCLLSHFAH